MLFIKWEATPARLKILSCRHDLAAWDTTLVIAGRRCQKHLCTELYGSEPGFLAANHIVMENHGLGCHRNKDREA